MADKSKIEWINATWNPWHGCHKVSPGCKYCYMYRDKTRYGQDPNTVVRSSPATFNAPLRWKEPARVFTCSWSDWFVEEADDWRDEAWDIIRRTPHLTYQILTKRPERILCHLPADWGNGWPNVWLGVSVENQEYADKRIPLLLQMPAAVRWVSAEPLLGPIELREWRLFDGRPHVLPSLDWLVVGGESGPHARPMHPDWARSLRDQCRAAGVAHFFKQWGEWMPNLFDVFDDYVVAKALSGSYPTTTLWSNEQVVEGQRAGTSLETYRVGKHAAGRLLDGREWNEYPATRQPA